jgi:hypothetical protein
MRQVRIVGSPPEGWIEKANAVTAAMRMAGSIEDRKKILEKNEGLWRDDRIRDWLLQQFNNKCWYSEAYDSASSIHVDHYRPKGRLKEFLGGDTFDGYWWLAFEWKNYRICGQLINVKKGDLFPIIEGQRCTSDGTIKLELESPILLDPADADDTSLISFEKDEDGCVAVCVPDANAVDKERVKQSIEILGLNRLDRLNKKRAVFWERCLREVVEYSAPTTSQALRKVAQASARKHLKEMIDYKAEFSSVAIACIQKNAPSPLIAAVFGELFF